VTAALTILAVYAAVTGCAGLYLLPVIIGTARRAPDMGSVAVINILLGWTLAGWAIALALALRSPAPPPAWALPAAPPPRPGTPPLILPPRPGGPGPDGRP
jgi:Superinfection immunity protein